MNQGEVKIELGGGEYVLRPTLDAMKKINRAFGGFAAAQRELMGFNTDAVVVAVSAGLGKSSNEFLNPEAAEKVTVEDAVYLRGAIELSNPVAKFVGYCSNGGRDPDEKKAAAPGEA